MEHLTVILLVRQLREMVMQLDRLMVKLMLRILDEWMRHWRTQRANQLCSWRIPCGATHLVFQFVMDLDHMMVELSVCLVYQLVMDFDHSTVRLLVHLLDDMMRHQMIQ